MPEIVFVPFYGEWHNFDVLTGDGTPDTPVDAAALAHYDAALAAAFAQFTAQFADPQQITAPWDLAAGSTIDGAAIGLVPASIFIDATRFIGSGTGSPTLAVAFKSTPAITLHKAQVDEVCTLVDRLPSGWTQFDVAAVLGNAAVTSGGVRMEVRIALNAEGGVQLDAASGTAHDATGTFAGTTGEEITVPLATGVAIGPGQKVAMTVRRVSTAGADTDTGDVRFRGLRLSQSITSGIPLSGSTVVISGIPYTVQSPEKSYSLVPVLSNHNAVTFELHPLDNWSHDGLDSSGVPFKNRCELKGPAVPYGVDYWLSYGMKIPSATTLPVADLVLGQWHSTRDDADTADRAPALAVRMLSDGTMNVSTCSDATDPSVVTSNSVTRYSGAALSRDAWHHIVMQVQFNKTGNGKLNMWLDGSQIINLGATIPLGFNDAVGCYWKFGAYTQNQTGVSDKKIVEYGNMELGTTDLTARIASPLTDPT